MPERDRLSGGHVLEAQRDVTEAERALAHSIVNRLRAEFDLRAERADLDAAAMMGLVEAKTRFDPTRGAQFSTFAYYRIRGSVLDFVRKSGAVSRRAYAKIRQAEAFDAVAESVGDARAAAPNERRDLDATVAALDDCLHQLTATFVLECVGQSPHAPSETAEELLCNAETVDAIHAAVDALPERERALVRGHYLEGRRFDEIAAELGVSKSWASRMHTKALQRLRGALEER